MQLKVSWISTEDLDHFVKNYDKNVDKLESLSCEIAKREARIEHGAGSVIKIINDKSSRDGNNKSVDHAKLITEIAMLHDVQDFTRLKLDIVDRVIGYYRFMQKDYVGKILELRKQGLSFEIIAKQIDAKKSDVYNDVKDAYRFAIKRL